MWLLLALGALLTTAGVALHERARVGTASPPLLTSKSFGDGQLETGHVYRVHARLDAAYARASSSESLGDLTSNLSQSLATAGFSEVMLAAEDPTDPRVWSFLARWGLDQTSGRNAPPLAIYDVQEVVDPDLLLPSFPEPSDALDAGLSFPEANAVAVALRRETDPNRLADFAISMALDFPISESLLRAKAHLLVKPVTPASKASFDAVSAGAEAPAAASSAVASSPLAKAALLEYRQITGAAP